jgi:hypothetical protein
MAFFKYSNFRSSIPLFNNKIHLFVYFLQRKAKFQNKTIIGGFYFIMEIA